jgi:HK97 gp10 family phage protein
LREVHVALRKLPDATAKNIIRRILKRRGERIAKRARDLAPKDQGHLIESIRVGTKLSKRQRRSHKKFGPDDIEVFIGPGPDPAAHLQEFGSSRHGAQPFMRPAWDAEKRNALDGIGDDLWAEIRKAAERAARKAAKG